VGTKDDAAECGHVLCALVGGACSLVVGFSRGCSSELRAPSEIEAEVFEEIRGLVDRIGAARAPLEEGAARDAAVRLAAIVRREAREGRGVVVQARDEAPELAAALARLCARRR
jgi:hypothetical protein